MNVSYVWPAAKISSILDWLGKELFCPYRVGQLTHPDVKAREISEQALGARRYDRHPEKACSLTSDSYAVA